MNAGYPIKQDETDVRTFASDTEGIGYDDEVFYESEKDSVARRENESTRSRYPESSRSKLMSSSMSLFLKHHAMAGVSGCLRILRSGVLITHAGSTENRSIVTRLSPKFLEHKVLKEKLVLNIVDGLVGSFDRGPTYHAESAWNYGGLFISTDPVILDVLVLQTVNQKREEMELDSVSKFANHISTASKLDLGTNTLDQADLRQVEV